MYLNGFAKKTKRKKVYKHYLYMKRYFNKIINKQKRYERGNMHTKRKNKLEGKLSKMN